MVALFNQIYIDCIILYQQKHGLVVCIPKKFASTKPTDYRHITLLNTDYKILVRIIAKSLRPIPDELLLLSQHFGVSARGIFVAEATIRNAIAYAELSHAPLCILSLYFTEAFDRIAYRYCFRLLTGYAFSTKFIALIDNMYDKAISSIYINRHTTGLIPIVLCATRLPDERVAFRFEFEPVANSPG